MWIMKEARGNILVFGKAFILLAAFVLGQNLPAMYYLNQLSTP
jgi:hypothetical protein